MTEASVQLWRRLDPAVLARLEPDVTVIAAAAIDQVRAGLKQPLDEATAANLRTTVTAALTAFFAEIEHAETVADREVYRAQGRAQHTAGRSLEEMLRFYQLGALGVWRQLTSSAHAAELPIRAVVELGEALFAFIAELSASAADGYAEARSRAARAGQAQRDRLLGLLLAEPPTAPDLLDDAARDASWLPPDRVLVAVTSAEVSSLLLDRLPSRVLAGRRLDLTVAIIPTDRADWYLDRLRGLLGAHQAGLGPVVALRETARSARRATALWRLATGGTLGTAPVVRAADHHIDLMLTADRELAAEFAAEVLAPLAGLAEPVRQRLTTTLAAWLARPDQPQAIGAELHVHVQTVRYRLRQLRDLFGGTIDDPAGRFALAIALRVFPHTKAMDQRDQQIEAMEEAQPQ
ncbi:PucR family transcriptional regulator [Amycolatopsis saalfeldensis]|uniref:PucR C-terminal helix-turn-helix domain-containing protein n=1 Tax=Amycolatopsis saalfeldensis TaxID=394193 RepID=A0A1H8YAG6_9PSEU|nr:PucR family transcriptional regulator [Amycolatopsis saalfeldensis]SEP49001.1 PucR C-terminal helix-turn-helix domain-containing protein [Amycolatopsis saalfeldensis]